MRDRLGALADELGPGKTRPATRRSYARSFDDGTTIELQTEEEVYRPRSIPAVEANGEEQPSQAREPEPVQAQGFSHWTALRASWSPGVRSRTAAFGSPSERASRRRARRHRRRVEERSESRVLGRSGSLAVEPSAAPATPADAGEPLLDPEVLRKDLQGLASMRPAAAPPPEAGGASPAAPSPAGEPATPPKLTHEIFDDLRRGQAGPALAAMKSASKSAGPGHAVFDRFPQGLSQAARYDVGTFDVTRRFDELDRRLEAAWTPPPAPPARPEAASAPALLPFELRADLEQMRPRARDTVAAPPQVVPFVKHEGVPLVAQEPGISADAACAVMLVGWRLRKDTVDGKSLLAGEPPWAAHKDHLNEKAPAVFAAFGLGSEPHAELDLPWLAEALSNKGPLWIGPDGSTATYPRVIIGAAGDGTPTGTKVFIHDPVTAAWGRAGGVYTETIETLREKLAPAGASSRRGFLVGWLPAGQPKGADQ